MTALPAASAGSSTGPSAAPPADGEPTTTAAPRGRFHIQLHNFDGPFDLLLQLISSHRMDVTEVALHIVTDEFIAHLRSLGDDWDLGQATEFLVVAATLLDLKAARLLPDADVEDEADLAILEARDLLFARLMAYKAYQQVAVLLKELEATALRRYPRAVTLEGRYLGLLPEVEIGLSPHGFAEFASGIFRPKPPPPTVSLAHIHASRVSVAEHTAAIRDLLAARGVATFAELIAGCTETLEVVARFLGLLNLYREAAVLFDQPEPLGELTVRWSGGDADTVISDEEYE
ncbi:segregation and condensation protein A [Nakamurella deserti]|uniref:segregation and condensation protein A n=1 Tax=Nakamurella deserti TaxID=2164074 RepID=UPI000DBEA279|nr:segregation/condensation protein A [Nakamurella deserti]